MNWSQTLRQPLNNHHAARWSPPVKARLREVWNDVTIPKSAMPAMFGRTLAAIENQAAKMHMGPRPVATRTPKESPAAATRRKQNESAAKIEAEQQADRIRAYWRDRGRDVQVEVVKIPIRNGKPVFSARIIGGV
jgi:hypothetical protein